MTRNEHKLTRLAVFAALWLPALFAVSAWAPEAKATEAGTLATADAEYEVQHYAAALAAYEQAAHQGDHRAQEVAGLMCLYGDALYGPQVSRDLPRARYWLQQAAAGGSEVAQSLLKSWKHAPTASLPVR